MLFSIGEWVVPHSQVSSHHGHGHPGGVEIRSASSFYSFGSWSPSTSGVIGGLESEKALTNFPATQTTSGASYVSLDIKDSCCFQLQSRAVNMDEPVGTEEHVTVDFVDETEGQSEQMPGSDKLLNSDIFDPSVDLATFMARPVRIYTTTLAQGAAFGITRFDPWDLFLSNTAVSKKIENFHYIRGNLHINVLVNSTPFVYGLYALSYCPTVSDNSLFDTTGDARATDAAIRTSYTQRPTLYLEPHVNKGGTMRLPFIYLDNFIEVQGTERTRLGSLDLYPIVSLATASTNTNGCTVSVYAWMEDVKLAGPTLQLQSDEYATGPVSSVATAVAAASNKLTKVPVIGKFARATEIGSGALAKIASLFGFSKVSTISDVQVFRNMTTRGMASGSIADAFEKLALDPKTELSVDTEVAGFAGGDELNIASLCARECVLTTAAWQQGDAVDTTLFHANVCPTMAVSSLVSELGASRTVLYDTPMGSVSRMFYNWRGTLVYTVKLVASQYHQGRLIVSFDPAGNTPTAGSENTIVSKIWDIQETDELVFKIPFISSTNWKIANTNISPDFSVRGATSITFNDDYHVGRFSIRVGTALLAPLASANATLVIKTHMEDGEFAVPRHIDTLLTPLPLQSKEIALAQETPVAPELYGVNMGERIQSLRSLMQRSTFYHRDVFQQASGNTKQIVRNKMYPLNFGFQENTATNQSWTDRATSVTVPTPGASDRNFWFTDEGPVQWMAPNFVGLRGSFKWTIYAHNFGNGCRIIAGRDPRSYTLNTGFNRIHTTTTAYTLTRSQVAADMLTNTATQWTQGGISMTSSRVNPSLVVEVPFQSHKNFEPTGSDVYYGSSLNGSRPLLWYYCLESGEAASTTAYVDMYGAAGTDFTMCGFVNIVPRYYFSTMPTPV